jgi:hypothetical protein
MRIGDVGRTVAYRCAEGHGSKVTTGIILSEEALSIRLPSSPAVAFSSEFLEHETKERQWTAFNWKNKRYIESVRLETVELLRARMHRLADNSM